MKSPLRYQATRYDCGTTSFVNALLYLFERDELPPEVVNYVTAVTLDRYQEAVGSPGGTSAAAMAFLASWMNDYARMTGFPVRTQALRGGEVTLRDDSALVRGLSCGAVAVVGCCLGADHYVLITHLGDDEVELFDPYYDTWPLHELDVEVVGVRMVDDRPHACNRRVRRWVLDEPAGTPYTLEAKSGRDAVLFWRT